MHTGKQACMYVRMYVCMSACKHVCMQTCLLPMTDGKTPNLGLIYLVSTIRWCLFNCSKMKHLRVFLNDKAVNFAKSLVNVKQYSTNIVQILLTIMVISLKS